MEANQDELRLLNIKLGEAESRGDADYFRAHLAPAFAMRRAKPGVYDDRDEFISKVAASPARTTDIESITVYGNRAIAVYTLSMEGKQFSDLRLFPRPRRRQLGSGSSRRSRALGPNAGSSTGAGPQRQSQAFNTCRRTGVHSRTALDKARD